MTVYVDDMRAQYRRMVMCHMLADTDDELHAMAARIGVARKWWQSPEKTSGSHYDIALSKRALAVQAARRDHAAAGGRDEHAAPDHRTPWGAGGCLGMACSTPCGPSRGKADDLMGYINPLLRLPAAQRLIGLAHDGFPA